MPIKDAISELNRVRDAGLIQDYAIGGAVAAIAYIEAMSTEDVDVFAIFADSGASFLAPLGPVWHDLVAHGAKVDGEYLVIGGWPVQLLPSGGPLYDEAIASAVIHDFDGVSGNIMPARHLAAIAIQTARGKDYQRVDEFIRADQVSIEELKELVERFGLRSSWETFLLRYPQNHV
jgi:hypothetical protein